MPIDLVDDATDYPVAIIVPEAGDERVAESVAEGFRRLGNRTATERKQLKLVERNLLRDYGAAQDGSDVTTLLNTAITAANADFASDGQERVVRVPPGKYGLKPSAASSWLMPLNGGSAQVHVACPIKSGVRLECKGATFVALPPAGADPAWVYALFATPTLNTAAGTYKQFSIVDATFDFTTAFWTTGHEVVNAVIAVSVDDLQIIRPRYRFTGGVAGAVGRGGKYLNCRKLTVDRFDALNIGQGAYLGYCTDVEISGRAEGTHEGIDFDCPCWTVDCKLVAKNLSGTEKQACDISGVVDGKFDLTVDGVGNAFIIYAKPEGFPTFAEWVTGFPASSTSATPVQPARNSIKLRGKNIHHATDKRSWQVNLNRADFGVYWAGKGHISGLKLDIDIDDCDGAKVWECDGIAGRVVMRNVTTGSVDGVDNAGLILSSHPTVDPTESKLSGDVDVVIKTCDRTGLRIMAPTNLRVRAEVASYNSANDAGSGVASGVWVSDLARKAGFLVVEPSNVSGGALAVTPHDLRYTYDGAAGPCKVVDRGGHSLKTTGGVPYSVAGTSAFAGGARVAGQAINTTGATNDLLLFPIFREGARLVALYAVNEAAITGTSGTNYTSISARRLRAGAVSSAIGTDTPYDNADRTAGTVVSLQVDGTNANGVFIAGDFLAVRLTKNGTGSSRTGISFVPVYTEYSL